MICNIKSFFAWLAVFLLTLARVSNAHAGNDVHLLTLSIVSYSKWSDVKTPNLCIVDNPSAATALKKQVQQLGYHVEIEPINSNQFNKSNCQAVFFGETSPRQQQKMIDNYPNKALLSFSNNNLECEVGSIICFYQINKNITFKINLDALSQATVHIDPRVLLLAKNSYGTQ